MASNSSILQSPVDQQESCQTSLDSATTETATVSATAENDVNELAGEPEVNLGLEMLRENPAHGPGDKALSAVCKTESTAVKQPRLRARKTLAPQLKYVELKTISRELKLVSTLRKESGDYFRDLPTGVITAAGLVYLALLEPMHVIGKNNHFWCVAGLRTFRLLQQALSSKAIKDDAIVPVMFHDRLGAIERRSLICSDLFLQPVVGSLHFRSKKPMGKAWDTLRDDEMFKRCLSVTGRPALAFLLGCDPRSVGEVKHDTGCSKSKRKAPGAA